MTTTLIRLYSGQPGSSNTTLYTCPSSTKVRVLAATVTNEGTTTRYITFHLVEAGGSPADNNIIANRVSIGSRESYTLPELLGHVLGASDYISAISEAADELTVHISGVAIT